MPETTSRTLEEAASALPGQGCWGPTCQADPSSPRSPGVSMTWARDGNTLSTSTWWVLGIGVGDAVGQDVDAVVAVGGVDEGGQDDAAGADPGEHQGVDAAVGQLLVEVGGGGRAEADLADDDVAVLGRDPLVDLGGGVLVVQHLAPRRPR